MEMTARKGWDNMETIAILEFVKLLGGALGAILTLSAVITLLVKPIREKFARWINKTANTQEFNDKFADVNGKLDQLTELVTKTIEQNEKLQAEIDKQSNALQATLRNSILNLYYKCKERGSITMFEKQNLMQLYENYTALNGNSFVKDCVSQLLVLDIEN